MEKTTTKYFSCEIQQTVFFESLKKTKICSTFFWTRFSDLDCSLLFYRQHLLRREKHRYLKFYKCGLNSASIGLRHKKMTDLSEKFFTSLKNFKTAEQSRFQGLESSVPLWLKNCALKKKLIRSCSEVKKTSSFRGSRFDSEKQIDGSLWADSTRGKQCLTR